MSTKKIVTTISILTAIAIALIIYPSANVSLSARQLAYTGNETNLNLYQQGNTQSKTYTLSSSSIDVISKYFGKAEVEKTLNKPGCVGVRMYYEKRNNGLSGYRLVGFDKNGNETTGIFMPNQPCPPICV